MIRLVIFDLDGTLWRGEEPISGAPEALRSLRKQGILVRFVTNNSSLSHADVVQKLTKMGFEAEDHEVLGSGPYAAQVCRSRGFQRVFVVGERALHEAFEEFERPLHDADVVVAGIDRDFNYQKCDAAFQFIRHGAKFFATNRDATYPLEQGHLQPGAGAIVAAIEAASGVKPELLGKPSPGMLIQLMDQAGVSASECLVVGDRLDTDIAAGQEAGCQTLLVLTGATLDPVPGVRTMVSVADLADRSFFN